MSKIDPRGGDQHFSNKSEIQKESELSGGQGVKPNSDIVLKFFRFLIMTPPLSQIFSQPEN